MTCHFYYKCECDHEKSDEGDEDMKNYVCPKCGNHIFCTRKNQIICCDFENNIDKQKDCWRFLKCFIP